MQPFRTHTGIVATLLRRDIDTDQIIPKQFLKRIGRTGFGECLFYDWRNDPSFSLTPGASILVTGANFGCGSSREHAAWALAGYGFRAIVAPSFADIFVANCTNNGLAAIAVGEDVIAKIGRELTIDLERCELRDDRGVLATFAMESFRRERLLNGWDEIGLTLRHEDAITRYETARASLRELAPDRSA
jgi:3-isopropylmalate/(R)-2-methylmalate dehydratase small subunit